MDKRLQFQDKLSGILSVANQQDKKITTKEVIQYFSKEKLTKEQMDLVFDYLTSQKVHVIGYEKKGGTVSSAKSKDLKISLKPSEDAYLQDYLEELKVIKEELPGERKQLFERLIAGDKEAKARITEIYLFEVAALAKEKWREEVTLGDLIGEGNMSLIEVLDQVVQVETAHEMIMNQISRDMDFLFEEQREIQGQGKRMIEKVKQLDKDIKALMEELGREVTVDELALFTDKNEDEVEDILKLLGEDGEG